MLAIFFNFITIIEHMRHFLTCILLFLLVHFSFGQNHPRIKQDYQTEFESLDIKDGLSSNKVLDIIQDKVGYLWFATTDGLNRYDGYHFLVFRNQIMDSTSLSNNLITCIEEDIYGDLWVGTQYGLNKYNRKTNQFEHYFKQSDKNSISNNYIRALHADNNGILWIETVEGVLNKMHLHNGIVEHYQHIGVSQNYYYYHCIFQENDSILWVGGRNIPTHRFNINTEKFERFEPNPNDPTKKREADIACYFQDSENNFYVSALDGTYLFDKKSVFDKILTSSTFSIIEDKERNIWFGTGNGIYKKPIDSSFYYHYNFNANNPSSLIGNHINKIFQDRSGVIWVASNSGLSKHSPTRKNFLHYFHIPGDSNTVSSNQISHVTEDKEGNIWIATANKGIDKFDRKNNQFTNYNAESKSAKTLSSNRVSDLYFDKSNTLWVSLWAGLGINRFDSKTESFERFAIDKKTRKLDWYNDILEDQNGELFLAVWGGAALYNFDKEKNQIQNKGRDLQAVPNGQLISKITKDREGNFWLASPNFGLDMYSPAKQKLYYYRNFERDLRYNFDLAQKLESNNYIPAKIPKFSKLNDLITDRDNNIWMATDRGIIYLEKKLNKFKLISPEKVVAIAYDSITHVIWTANTQGVFEIKIKTEKKTKYKWPENFGEDFLPKKLFYSHLLKTLFFVSNKGVGKFSKEANFENYKNIKGIIDVNFDDDGNIWIAKQDSLLKLNSELQIKKGYAISNAEPISAFLIAKNQIYLGIANQLFTIDLNANHWQPKQLLFKPLYGIYTEGLKILSLEIANNSNLVLMGTNKGLFKYYKHSGSYEMQRQYEFGFSNQVIHLASNLLEDASGNLWIGTTNTGLSKKHPKSQITEQYAYNPLDTNSYWGNHVSASFEDSQGRLWFAGEGLNLYHPEKNSFSHFTMEQGLPSNNLNSIVEDNNHNLWLGTDKGLVKFTIETESFKTYLEADGTHTNNYNKAGIKLSSGELLFGSNSGFIIFNPDSLKQNLLIPPVVLTRIKIFENEIFEDLSETPFLNLRPNQNTITFEFSALDYNLPKINKYRYKLEGSDENWEETSSDNRSIRYTNLPPGDYIFMLKGSNNNGVWGSLSTPVQIHIKAPFWKRWWFIVLASLALIGIIILLVLYREKELLKEKKTRELEHRFLRSQMNPHFIFNSLGAIQSYIFKNKPIDAGTYLSNFSELVRLILDNSRHEQILLKKEIKTLEHYLGLQKLRFPDKLNFYFEIDESLNTESIKIPPMMLQPFIENSIEHGFKKAKNIGTITIRIRKETNGIVLETEDNGIGILASEKESHTKEPEHHSLATKITRERIKNLNKGRKQKIVLEIIDLSSLQMGLNGTRVSIRIPLKHINFVI